MPKAGDWVLIHGQTLASNQRAPQVPADTKQVPLEMWVKGALLADAKLGEVASVKTVTGRTEVGILQAVNPVYRHSFGEFVPELLTVNQELAKLLNGGER